MNEVILKLQKNLEDIFPEISALNITPETMLEEIPDWDSMAAVNLQVFLNQHYNINLEQEFLTDETPFKEIMDKIKDTES